MTLDITYLATQHIQHSLFATSYDQPSSRSSQDHYTFITSVLEYQLSVPLEI